MDFSIIIINYNTKELLRNCLNSIFINLKGEFEVIVVDNNSSDESVSMIKKEFKNKVLLIENKKNKGFGSANNQAVHLAVGKFLFFLNSDTIINNNILKNIYSKMKNNNIGILAPCLLLKNGEKQKYAYGKFPNLFNSVLEKIKKDTNHHNIDWVSGAAFIIRKDVFNKIEGFDENYFMYFEDIDLCKKVKNLNYKIIVNNETSLIHLGGKSISKGVDRKKLYYKSQDYFYNKHYGILSFQLLRLLRKIYLFLK